MALHRWHEKHAEDEPWRYMGGYENPDRKELPGDYPYRFVDRDLE